MSTAAKKPADPEAQLKALEDEYAFDDTGIADPSPPPAPASTSPNATSGASTPKAEPAEEPRPAARDLHLLARAEAYGISKAEIAEMTDAELRRAVGYLDRLEATRQRMASEPSPAPPAAPAEEDIDIGLPVFDEEKNPTGYDPALVALLKAQAKKIATLEKRLGGIEGIEQRRANESRADWLDRVFGTITQNDTEIAALIGSGTRHDLEPKGMEMGLRSWIIGRAVELAGGEEKLAADHIVEATRAVVKKPAAPQSANPPVAVVANAQSHGAVMGRPTAEEWEQGGLARPTHRTGSPEPKGKARAEKAVAEKMRAAGLDPGPLGGDEEDDLPD